jgi:hypothetical protein
MINFKMPTVISLNKIQYLWDNGRISDPLMTPLILKSAAIKRIQHGVYIRGDDFSNFKLNGIVLFATHFDSFAINKIESLGGHAVSIYLTENSWRKIGNKVNSLSECNLKHLPPDDWAELNFYSDFEKRGYLNERVLDGIPLKAKEFIQKNFIFPHEVNYQKIPC